MTMGKQPFYDRELLHDKRARSLDCYTPYNESVTYSALKGRGKVLIYPLDWNVEASPSPEDGTLVPRIRVWTTGFPFDNMVTMTIEIKTIPNGTAQRVVEIPAGAIEVVSTGWTCCHELDLSTAVIKFTHLILK